MTTDSVTEENRRIRLLRISSDMLVNLVYLHQVPYDEAERLIIGLKNLASNLFPGKEDVFDLIYMPRLRRALRDAGYSREFELKLVPARKRDHLRPV